MQRIGWSRWEIQCKTHCEPDMKMKKPYELKLSVEVVGGDGRFRKAVRGVTIAECSCPPGEARMPCARS